MELRKHQSKAIEDIKFSFRMGNRKVVLAAPCSFGKTIVSAWLMKQVMDRGKTGLFLCDRIKLIDQTIKAFQINSVDFGVLQGEHELEDLAAPIQIASVQTLARRRVSQQFDLIIVDECHTQYSFLQNYLHTFPRSKIIGLSATPFSKGLGDYYQDLIVPCTTMDLLEKGFLAPVKYYSGSSFSTKGIRTRGLATGGTDFDPLGLERAMDNNKKLVGDIVNNWLAFGEDAQTIAFTPSIKQSKFLVDTFAAAGITAKHIDCYMPMSERRKLFDQHDNGEFKILSNAKLLNVGYDNPKIGCIVDCYPTRSKINFVQRIGRGLRIAEGKDYCIVLDHAGNVKRHGFAELIVPDTLHKAKDKFTENKQVKRTKKDPTNDCPKCSRIIIGIKCNHCGFEFPKTKALETTDELLVQMKGSKIKNQKINLNKNQWYAELKTMEKIKKYNNGWAYNMFIKKFGHKPNANYTDFSFSVSMDVKNFITSQMIKYAYSKKKNYLKNFREK